jgi:phosphoribosyl-ATP pyrophosphohydrolase/phosphoribosyl-AMP cyclohydrolase
MSGSEELDVSGMDVKKYSRKEALEISASLDFEKLDGVLPAVAVDDEGKILMLAFMNKEALEKTLEEGMMHYWSRSRKRLWLKGEESGHYQYVLGIYADCDFDSLLFRVRQVGNACHTGEYSCFYNEINPFRGGAEVLSEIEGIIEERMQKPRAGSYTTSVLLKGIREAAKKVSEEATEVSLAAVAEDKERTIYEAADLLYHLLLLLKMKGTSMGDVYMELAKRRQ